MTRLQPVDIGGNSWDNVNSPRSAVNTSEGLIATKERPEMNHTPRPPFMAPIVQMRDGEVLEVFQFRRQREVEKARADWMRSGPMGQAKDADGNPLYRIDDRARWYRTKLMKKSRRSETIERDGGKCVACGSTKQLEVDHIVRYIDGGSHDLANLRTLCAKCHGKRGGR